MEQQTPAKRSAPRGVRWWLNRDRTPSQRGINAAGAIFAGASVVVAIVALAFSNSANQSVTQIKSQTSKTVGTDQSTTTINNYYSVSGAPGQATPKTDNQCGDTRSKVTGGWGPDRPTFTMDHPAPFTTIDSIRNNPNFGDERGLMAVRDSTSAGAWNSSMEVQSGHTYRVRLYIENSTFDGSADLASTGTRIMVNLPNCNANRIASNGFITSETAYPLQIWGGITLTSDQLFNLTYVEGSALLESNGFGPAGKSISGTDFLTAKGQLVGYSSLDGVVQAGYQYAECFSFEVRPQFAS